MLSEASGPDPPGFANYSDILLRDDDGALVIWPIARAEYVVIAILPFLPLARDAAVCVSCINPRMGGNGQGVFGNLQCDVLRKVDDISLL